MRACVPLSEAGSSLAATKRSAEEYHYSPGRDSGKPASGTLFIAPDLLQVHRGV